MGTAVLHAEVLADLLDREVDMARAALGGRAGDLHREGSALVMTVERGAGRWRLRLDGTGFDAEPFDIALVDEQNEILPIEGWIPQLAYGVHPVLGVPWTCVTGTRGYYLFPGHHQDRWDAVRHRTHAADLLDHLLTKAGV